MRSSIYDINPRVAIAPVVATDNTPLVSGIIDTLGYDSLAFLITTGTLADADATFAVSLEQGNAANLSDTTAVVAADLAGSLADAGFTFAADNSARKIGYLGLYRYVRLTITPSANTGNAPIGAVALLGHPLSAPTAAVPN